MGTLKSFHVADNDTWDQFTALARSQGRSATWAINSLICQAISANSLSLADSPATVLGVEAPGAVDSSHIEDRLKEFDDRIFELERSDRLTESSIEFAMSPNPFGDPASGLESRIDLLETEVTELKTDLKKP